MFKVVLINPYELGRQPFALAQPAAWLKRDGFEVQCLDLSLQKLQADVLAHAQLVAIYVGMHTATRIALEAIPRIRQIAPEAHLCIYGLYAPMNEALLRGLGVGTVLGGEFEPGILSLALRLRENQPSSTLPPTPPPQTEPVINLQKIEFLTPDRSGLPPLARYAHLQLPGGDKKTVAFAEGSRGCKHLCRHCPVVPVYQGKFRIVPVDVVITDIRQQVALGASHVSFGDPDFFNGPGHAMKLAQALHAEFPEITFDATIKVRHLIEHAELLPELKRCGCLFITSAVEAVDDTILQHLAKHHSSRDFDRAAKLLQQAEIGFAPTFVAFTPWTTLAGYRDLLQRLLDLGLAENVPPIQLCIRLLIPAGSYLLQLPGFRELIEDFDATTLGYPWRHRDARVDQLQQQAQSYAAQAEAQGLSRREIFAHIWNLTHAALGQPAPILPATGFGAPIARMSEPWYCCAEPTTQQLQSF